jgi:ornithine carbamoyltransferase
MGMVQLGGYAFYISPTEVGLGSRESAPDVTRVLSGYADGIMARVFDHQHIIDLIEWGSVPIINGLSDFSHPCQALTDIFTIWEDSGWANEADLAGMRLVYVGDGSNNVATSLIAAAGKVGLSMTVVSPEDYQPAGEALAESDADITVTDDH